MSNPEPTSWQSGPVLGIETSCDETAASVVGSDGVVLSNVIASQDAVHQRFGGVVPELASRAHVETIESVTAAAMEEAKLPWTALAGLAVTQGPGLAGALIVGVNYAKSLAYTLGLPLVGVSHLEGHIASAWLENPDFPLPCVVLVVSGGHTHLFLRDEQGRCRLLGCTRDDAAGEAFDKGAQMLGLGFPGGPALDRLARTGKADAIVFPKSRMNRNSLEFSFSGLKTALLYKLHRMDERQQLKLKADLAAGYQEAIVAVLVEKAFMALKQTHVRALAVVGGVSANSRLRSLLRERALATDTQISLPPLCFCTDNAAMVAAAGRQALLAGQRMPLDAEPWATFEQSSELQIAGSPEGAHS